MWLIFSPNFISWSYSICHLTLSLSFFCDTLSLLERKPCFFSLIRCFFFFTLIHSFLHISQTFEHWRVSLFELILFSVYTYSLGDLNKSHVLKNYSAAVDCQIHRSQNYFLDSSCPFGISILMSSEHNKFNIHRSKTPDFHPQNCTSAHPVHLRK